MQRGGKKCWFNIIAWGPSKSLEKEKMSYRGGEIPNQHKLSQKANDKHENRGTVEKPKDKNYIT